MSAAPVLRCSDWDGLIAALTAQEEPALPDGLERGLARAVLAAPAAAAVWIAHRMPELASRSPLRLLVVGAETVDAADGGRWYGMLPRLLDARGTVAATLVGAELDPAFATPAARFAPQQPARSARVRLSEFAGERGALEFDLALVFHPGLPKHRGWLEDGSVARLIAAGVPLVASSYAEDEFEMDRWVVESCGFEVAGDPVLNPFFLELDQDKTRARWGRVLWAFGPRVPPEGYVADGGRLARLDTLTRMVMHSMTDARAGGPDPGARVELNSQAGARLELIHVFDHRYLDPATRRLLRLGADGTLQACGQVGAAELERYPGAGGRPIERAVWAAGIKAAHLLPTYPSPGRQVDPQDKARELYAALRASAARLFGK